MKLCLRCNQYYNDVMETCPKDNSNLEPVGKDPLIGALINDRYVVDSVIGKGSSGIVYKAARLMMGGEVAVKVIHSYLGADGASLDRLLRELRAAEKLRHPHIITLWESGITDDGQPYLVMDYLEGITLSQMITQRGALPVPRVLNITRQVCEALTHAHDAGFIHRDMKPENIVLEENESRGDYAKVLDFGIADTPADSAARAKFGKPKTVAGSPAYMSPEQCQGFELDFRSDLYSVGVIVFEMFTGRRPFLAPDLVKLMYKTVTDPAPTMSQVRQDLIFPDKLEAVIAKALKKTPEERQNSLREFFAELEAACQGVEIKVKNNTAADHVPASELEFEPAERLHDDKPAARPRFEAGPEEMAEFQMPPPPPPRGTAGAPPAPGAGAPPPPPKPAAPQALSAKPLPGQLKPGAPPAPGSPPPPPGGRPGQAGAAPPGSPKTPPPPPPGGRPLAPPGAVPGAPRPQALQAGAPQPRPQEPGQPRPGGQPQTGQPRPSPAGQPQGAPAPRPSPPGALPAQQPNPNGQQGRVDENSPPSKSQGKLSSLVKRPAGVGPAPAKPAGPESASQDQMRGRDVRPPSVYSYVPPPEEVKKEDPPAAQQKPSADGPGPRPPEGQSGPGGARPGAGGAPGPGGPRPQGAPGQGPNKPGMRPQPGKPQSGPGSQGSGSPGSPANKPGPQQKPQVAGTKAGAQQPSQNRPGAAPNAQQPPQNRPAATPNTAPLKGLSEDEVNRAAQDLFGEGDNNNRLKSLDGHIPSEKDARALDNRRIGHLDWRDEIEALKTGSFEPISGKDLQPSQPPQSQVNWPPGTPLSDRGQPVQAAPPVQPAQVPPQQPMPQQQMPPMMPPYQAQSWPPGSIPPGQIPYDQSMSYPPGMMPYVPQMGYPPGYIPPGQMMPPGYQYPPTGPDGQPLPVQPGYVYGYPGMPMMPPGMVPMPGQQGYMPPGAMPPQMVPPGQQAPGQVPEGQLPQRPPGIVASPAEEDDYGDYEEEPSILPAKEEAPEKVGEAKTEQSPVVEEVASGSPVDLPLDSPADEFASLEPKAKVKSDSEAASKLSSLFGDPEDLEEEERRARREAAAASESQSGGPKPQDNVSPRKSLSALLALSASDSEVFSAGGGALSPTKEPAAAEEESKPASGFGKLFDKGGDEGAPKGGALGALLKAVQDEPESPYAPPKEPSLPTNPLNKGDDLLGGSDDLLGGPSSGLNKIPLATNEIADAVDKLFDDASGGGISALLGGDDSDDFSDASARFAKAMSDAEDDEVGGVRPHSGLHGGMDPELASQFPPPAPQPPRANDFANASTSTSDALSRLLEAASKAPDRPLDSEGPSDIDKMADRVNKPPARISRQLAALKTAEEESRASRTGMPPGMQDPPAAFAGFGAPVDDASGVRKSTTGAYSQDAVNARIAELNKKLEQQSLGGMNAELPPAMAPDPSVIPDRREVVNRIMEEAASRSGNSGYGPGPTGRSSSVSGMPAEGFSRSDLENINAQNLQSMAEAEARKGGSARGMKSRYGGSHIDWGKIIAGIAVVGVIGYVALNPGVVTKITNMLPKNLSINFGAGGGATSQESLDAQLSAQVDDLAKQGQLSSAIKLLIDEEKKNGLSTELSDKLDTLYISLAQYYKNKGDNDKAGEALKNVPPESVKYKEAQNLLKQLSSSKKGSKKKKKRG